MSCISRLNINYTEIYMYHHMTFFQMDRRIYQQVISREKVEGFATQSECHVPATILRLLHNWQPGLEECVWFCNCSCTYEQENKRLVWITVKSILWNFSLLDRDVLFYVLKINLWSWIAIETAEPRSALSSMSDNRSRGCDFEPQPGHITSLEIGHEIISPSSADSWRAVVSYWRKYLH